MDRAGLKSKSYGKDPLLEWFVQEDEILSKEERDRLIKKAREQPRAMKSEAINFWLGVKKEALGIKPDPKVDNKPKRIIFVSEKHIEKFKRWRKGL